MSGLARKQRRTEARREYERFTRMWREDMRLAGLYGKKTSYKRPTFSQWYAQHQHELGGWPRQIPVQEDPNDVRDYLHGQDPWAEQLDERITEELRQQNERDEQLARDKEPERGVATIQIVGDEEA